MIKKREKLKLTQYIQIYKNNDPLLLNVVNKYVLRAPARKNQTYRGKGGKFDFFHILMLHRLGYN